MYQFWIPFPLHNHLQNYIASVLLPKKWIKPILKVLQVGTSMDWVVWYIPQMHDCIEIREAWSLSFILCPKPSENTNYKGNRWPATMLKEVSVMFEDLKTSILFNWMTFFFFKQQKNSDLCQKATSLQVWYWIVDPILYRKMLPKSSNWADGMLFFSPHCVSWCDVFLM